MSDNVTSDQAASPQSLTDRIAAKFGIRPEEQAPQVEEQPEEVAAEEATAETESESPEEAAPAEPEFLEIEFEGERYQVPPKLKDALLRQSDYTKKTQEIAEQRKSLETIQAQYKAAQEREQFIAATKDEREYLTVLEKAISEAAKLDWQNMPMEQAFRTKMELDRYKEQRQQIADSLKAKETEFAASQREHFTTLRNQVREQVGKAIQGFDEKALSEYFTREGLTNDEIEGVLLDPRSAQIGWKARQWDLLQAQKATAVEAAKKAPPAIKPASARPMPQDVKDKLNFRKAMKAAPDSNAKAKLIEQRLAKAFGG